MSETIDTIARNFIASLSSDEIDYCTDEKHPDHFGFAGLQDLMDANVLLLDTIEAHGPEWIVVYFSVFNNLKAPSHGQNGWDYLNKCTDRIDEILKEKLA